jgi:hypothetical protein
VVFWIIVLESTITTTKPKFLDMKEPRLGKRKEKNNMAKKLWQWNGWVLKRRSAQ